MHEPDELTDAPRDPSNDARDPSAEAFERIETVMGRLFDVLDEEPSKKVPG